MSYDFQEQPPVLLHDLPARGAALWPGSVALVSDGQRCTYAELQRQIDALKCALTSHGLVTGDRVAVFLDKRIETVVASFAVTAAGGVLVPVNPVLKPAQVAHILQDSGATMLVTSSARLAGLQPMLVDAPELSQVLVVEAEAPAVPVPRITVHAWPSGSASGWADPGPVRLLETDIAAIFYTSGSTGRPKGVVLSHRNLVAGAASVASYLGNHPDDVLLAALPLSFDAGFSQLTTAFEVGARVVLLNYLLPRDVLLTMAREGVTGLTAVPPLYMQLAALDWPAGTTTTLRYWANTGGRMPRTTLDAMRVRAPDASPFLMYGLTEAFRSTFLPPDQVDLRPDSIGRAIPNVQVLVLREDGSECGVDEPGELVHRGPLVAQGYWRRPDETARRFRPLPARFQVGGHERPAPEVAVFSGDTVRRDAEGFLYFVGRRDDMIKTSGYRVSPTEVEEAVLDSGLVAESVALGVGHETLGQVIHVVAVPSGAAEGNPARDTAALLAHCRRHLPVYMVPSVVQWVSGPLPRNPNGKLDRQRWRGEHAGL